MLFSISVYANDFSSENLNLKQTKSIELASLNHSQWLNNTVEWWYNPLNQPFSTEQAIQAIISATQAWQNISGVKFVYKGISNQSLAYNQDDKVVVGWLDEQTFNQKYGNHSAHTAIWWGSKIIDGEMIFNAEDAMTISDVENFQGLATHEFGHLLGLDHSNDPQSIMFTPFHTLKYQMILRTDDVNAVRSLYPCVGCGDCYRVLNWAEAILPELFLVSGKQSVNFPPFVARYYPKSNTYLGYNAEDNSFYGLSSWLWGEQLIKFGSLKDYLDTAIQAGF